MNSDRIAKERMNVILLVDASKSMQGRRMKQVDDAIMDIKNYLVNLQDENSNVDFYMTIIPFSTEASFYDNKEMIKIYKPLDFKRIASLYIVCLSCFSSTFIILFSIVPYNVKYITSL